MMSYYQKAIDAIFKKIEDIAWDRADNFLLPYWRETCCDTGEGIILTYPALFMKRREGQDLSSVLRA